MWADRIPFDSWRIAPWGVKDVLDSGEAYMLPPNCTSVQAARRQGNVVYYDQAVWERLSEFQKALLITHEELYALGVEKGHNSSVYARNFIIDLLTAIVHMPMVKEGVKYDWQTRGDFLKLSLSKNNFGNYLNISDLFKMYEEKRKELISLRSKAGDDNMTNPMWNDVLRLQVEMMDLGLPLLDKRDFIDSALEIVNARMSWIRNKAPNNISFKKSEAELESIHQMYKDGSLSDEGFMHSLQREFLIQEIIINNITAGYSWGF